MDERALKDFRACVADTASQRQRVRELVACGQWRTAEPDSERARAYALRQRNLGARGGPESIIGDTEDFLRASFLAQGAAVARAVAYVEVSSAQVNEVATGFMVSPRLFLTNQHVIADLAAARGTRVSFLRELDERGVPRASTSFLLAPQRLALFSASDQLDYALIALGERQSGTATADMLGFCPLSDQPDKHVIGMNANIIQHPGGWLKMISIRNNTVTARTEHTLLYETDTEQGSSGSPVFNDDWQLVALHHWGEPYRDAASAQDTPRKVNEGIRISAIYRDLLQRLPTLPEAARPLLQEALSYQTAATPATAVAWPSAAASDTREETSMSTGNDSGAHARTGVGAQAATLTIPLEITVRVAGATATAASSPAAPSTPVPAQPQARRLSPPRPTHAQEALRIDPDYSKRSGYDPAFIAGVQVPLPQPDGTLAAQIVPLLAEDAAHGDGELKYEHFSIKLLKPRRLAAFTATNIDGARYLEVDRGSGRVNGAEGDAWFRDPRVPAGAVLEQDFYGAWSNYFDRGHLTRRSDPSWGSPEEAERANADTFHFTNCSPQHFRFNQSAVYWQGLERYVLENGVLASSTKGRLCVFQGPVFNDQVDLWADEVQIPSSFFKIVVWKGKQGLRAVALVADQSALLSESRHSLGAPQALPSVEVNHWRVAVPEVEQMTGLDFGKLVRQADTIAAGQQPQVGEARQRITSFDQIRL
ncbi:DNA/RNA non-specific endonuclease [Herbaspirillum seropedicae]|uniref:DNA/RNA non-specific endonuclease n=1 Tax=Herbaspirillum seropedicae TaxID=964 RepID=UPI000863A41A|nr:DNA/RNA non-specific endonuclease [Herbaspirillum seropedicae]AON53488.1 DNA/RNA non-specific endonuclease [Herbaspirillum seropedicae]